MRDPFGGPGKREPLKYALAGRRSRRVTQERRLVYRVTDEAVDFLQARYHDEGRLACARPRGFRSRSAVAPD